MLDAKNRRKEFPITRFRQRCADWFQSIALILLLVASTLFIWMWIRAYLSGAIPDIGWSGNLGNHGPWRHFYNLRDLWWQIFFTLTFAFYSALISFLLKRGNMTACITFLIFATVLLFLFTHYWLVD